MNQNQHSIAAVTRSVTALPSRRDVLRGLAGAGLGQGVARLPAVAARKRKRKNKDKKPKPNAFGCLSVGAACSNADQCCSGVCERQGKKRTCIAHNSGLCRPNHDACAMGKETVCKGGVPTSLCWLTTGKAGFCGNFGTVGSQEYCRHCTKDTDCQAEFGPGAACIDLRGFGCAASCPDTGGIACMAAVV